LTREVKKDTEAILEETGDIKLNTENILAEIHRLQAQLPQGAQASSDKSDFILRKYLDELTSYAGSVVGDCDNWPTSDASIQEITSGGDEAWMFHESYLDGATERVRANGSAARSPLQPTEQSDEGRTTLPLTLKIPREMPAPPSLMVSSSLNQTEQGNGGDTTSRRRLKARKGIPASPSLMISSSLNQAERGNEGSTTPPPIPKAPREMPAPPSSMVFSIFSQAWNQTEIQARPRERDEFTWDLEFEHIGLESTREKGKREGFVQNFISVPDSEVGPRYGTAYQATVDYVMSDLRIEAILPEQHNRNIAAMVKWIRQFTMSGGDVNRRFSLSTSRGRSLYAIIAALALRDSEWLDYLLKAGANVNVVGVKPWAVPSGFLALFGKKTAGTFSHALDWDVSTARKLVQAGAKPTLGEKSELASVAATKTESLPMLEPGKAEDYLIYVAKFLLENGAEVNSPSRPPLHACIGSTGYASMVRFLLDNGADPNQVYSSWGTSLHYAVKHDRFDIIKILVDAGAKCDATAKVAYSAGESHDETVLTPVELANRLGKLKLVNQALDSNFGIYQGGVREIARKSNPEVRNNTSRVNPEQPVKASREPRRPSLFDFSRRKR